LGIKELEMQDVDEKSHLEMTGIERDLEEKHSSLLDGIRD
jgi:hypothetical protein